MIKKYKPWIISLAAFLTACGTIYASPVRPVLLFEFQAHAAEFQADKCISKIRQRNNAYARRDDYLRHGDPVPNWLEQQIAELEQYIHTYC